MELMDGSKILYTVGMNFKKILCFGSILNNNNPFISLFLSTFKSAVSVYPSYFIFSFTKF